MNISVLKTATLQHSQRSDNITHTTIITLNRLLNAIDQALHVVPGSTIRKSMNDAIEISAV